MAAEHGFDGPATLIGEIDGQRVGTRQQYCDAVGELGSGETATFNALVGGRIEDLSLAVE